jgi:hypothetical protein
MTQSTSPTPVLGIIGGSGLYDLPGLVDTRWVEADRRPSWPAATASSTSPTTPMSSHFTIVMGIHLPTPAIWVAHCGGSGASMADAQGARRKCGRCHRGTG